MLPPTEPHLLCQVLQLPPDLNFIRPGPRGFFPPKARFPPLQAPGAGGTAHVRGPGRRTAPPSAAPRTADHGGDGSEPVAPVPAASASEPGENRVRRIHFCSGTRQLVARLLGGRPFRGAAPPLEVSYGGS